MTEAYMRTIDVFYINKVIELLEMSSDEKITFAQFEGIAAFSERYFFNIFKWKK